MTRHTRNQNTIYVQHCKYWGKAHVGMNKHEPSQREKCFSQIWKVSGQYQFHIESLSPKPYVFRFVFFLVLHGTIKYSMKFVLARLEIRYRQANDVKETTKMYFKNKIPKPILAWTKNKARTYAKTRFTIHWINSIYIRIIKYKEPFGFRAYFPFWLWVPTLTAIPLFSLLCARQANGPVSKIGKEISLAGASCLFAQAFGEWAVVAIERNYVFDTWHYVALNIYAIPHHWYLNVCASALVVCV